MTPAARLDQVELPALEEVLKDALPCDLTYDECDEAARWLVACPNCSDIDFACDDHLTAFKAWLRSRDRDPRCKSCDTRGKPSISPL